MDSDAARGIDRRRLVKWGGVAAAGVVAAGGKFSGVVLLSHWGRTVLSRSYGMADRERGIANHEGVAFSLSSAGKPFHAVAILQLAQRGKLKLSDRVGTYLTGFAKDIAEQVTIHHLLASTSGLVMPDEDVQRIFGSREEVHEYREQLARQSKLVAPVGTPTDHEGANIIIPALIVEAVTGKTYWDYVEENIFGRCGMTGSAFYTRPQWLTDKHIAHPYMMLADGSVVDAVRNLDKSSPRPDSLGKNPGRAFIDAPGDGANWDIYPYTGWVGVILANSDGVPLQEMIGREIQAITGASPGGGGGGG